MPKIIDLTGRIFSYLTVVSFSHIDKKSRRKWWNCRCDCGKEVKYRSDCLILKAMLSCGCKRRSQKGMSKSYLYTIWMLMKRRCFSKKDKKFHCYGGRGITVCRRWLDFQKFFADMGHRPTESHSIERKDNDKNYEPGNCVWATQKEQMRNTSRNRILVLNGKRKCLTDWALEYRIDRGILASRLRNGWSVREAITRPVKHRGGVYEAPETEAATA